MKIDLQNCLNLDAANGSLVESRQQPYKNLTIRLSKTIGNMHYEMSRKSFLMKPDESKGNFLIQFGPVISVCFGSK